MQVATLATSIYCWVPFLYVSLGTGEKHKMHRPPLPSPPPLIDSPLDPRIGPQYSLIFSVSSHALPPTATMLTFGRGSLAAEVATVCLLTREYQVLVCPDLRIFPLYRLCANQCHPASCIVRNPWRYVHRKPSTVDELPDVGTPPSATSRTSTIVKCVCDL